MNNVLARVRTFIEDNFLFRSDVSGLADSDSLLENGVMDSTGILELVAFLESDFAIQMTDAEIVPDNLDSIAAISAFLERKLGGAFTAVMELTGSGMV
jgi:acyl carrier protein